MGAPERDRQEAFASEQEWKRFKYGRIRLSEADAYDLYDLVRWEEKRLLQEIWDLKQEESFSRDEMNALKRAKKRMERIRFAIVELIREKDWNLPEDAT